MTADIYSTEKRSQIMSRVRGKDTGPEKIVRSLLHRSGFRFRLHVASLPGKPDIVLPRHRKVILIHGCFWHGHTECAKGRQRPATRRAFWDAKIRDTIARDVRVRARLEDAGWRILEIWECQMRHPESLVATLVDFMKVGAADATT
jgi:DNA mismatch endonuclease (patch repair protein)